MLVFNPGRSIQPSLMFTNQTGAYPSEASFRLSTVVYVPQTLD
jgi:hypothetical protein